MSWRPSASWLQRWFPKRWSEMIGNAEMVKVWMDFIKNGPCNAIFTGPSRSGKTRTISLGIRALACPHRTATLDPCGECRSCIDSGDGRSAHWGIFHAAAESDYAFHPIDCEVVTPEQLDELRFDGILDNEKMIIYLDEVAALRRRRLEGRLLKLLDESKAIWIASAISLQRMKGDRKGEWTERLSKEMKGRFSVKVGTSHPHPDDLHEWIIGRCREWEITILEETVTIQKMIHRTQRRVGYVMHFFVMAATRDDRTIGPDDVDRFNLDSTD